VTAAPPADDGVLPTLTFPRLSLAFVGVALFIFVIHSYKISVGQLAIIIGLFGVLAQRARFRLPPAFGWYLAFFAWAALSTATSDASVLVASTGANLTWEKVEDLGKVILISIVLANALRDASQVSGFFLLWLGCFALFPVRGTLFNFAFGIGDFGRYSWNFIFRNPNDLAGIILLMLGITLAAAQAGGKQIRLLAYIGTGILVLIVFLTQSRGAFLGLMVGAALAVTVAPEPWRRSC
jgi:hypothetical protein